MIAWKNKGKRRARKPHKAKGTQGHRYTPLNHFAHFRFFFLVALPRTFFSIGSMEDEKWGAGRLEEAGGREEEGTGADHNPF